LAIAGLTCAFAASATTGPVGNCSVGYLQSVAAPGTTIMAATVVAATATVPEYCRVDASATTVNNATVYQVGLPTTWNDKFYWGAQGGFAGTAPVAPALGLQRGYVSGITDTGHRGTGTSGAWAINAPDKVIDYGYRGIKAAVDSAKSLAAGYYQAPIKRSIMQSCSNGGRATMMHSQRYPGDFDGYLITAPAYDWSGQVVLDFYHSSSSFFAKAGSWLPADKIKLLSDAVLAACDGTDGVVDGVVSDPRLCTFNPRTLQCPGAGDSAGCLSKDQADAVVRFTSPLKNKFGTVVSPGWLLTGDEANAAGLALWKLGATPPPLDTNGVPKPQNGQAAAHGFMDGTLTGIVYNNADYDWRTFSIDNNLGYLAYLDGVLSATDPDVSPAVSRGAKFMFFHGWSDQALNPLRTIAYWQALVDRYGRTATDSFARLFLVPGMQHCAGGTSSTDTYDSLGEMEKWLDGGEPPARIQATKVVNGSTTRVRPLCAYPQIALPRVYGTLLAPYASNFNLDDPSNWYCGSINQ
jgi:feruloyl esterase